MSPGRRLVLLLLVVLAASSCSRIPRVELETYLDTSSELHAVSNGVLNVVASYERQVVRDAALTETTSPSNSEALDDFGIPITDEELASVNQMVIPAECLGRTGAEYFCYQLRSAFATIGDPPLVGSVRRLSTVLERYGAILGAYANGVSGDILVADIQRLQTQLNDGLALVDASAGGLPGGVVEAFQTLAPIAGEVGAYRDRQALADFLLDNYSQVDSAYFALANSSTELFQTVQQGFVQLLERPNQSPSELRALNSRRDEIRVLIANWTVLVDQSRRLLAELHFALKNPGTLESRLLELGVVSVQGLADAAIVQSQLDSLSLPSN